MCKRVANSTTKLWIFEIISKSTTNNINSTFAIIRSNKGRDIIDDALTVVVEVTKALFDALKLDSEGNRSEVVFTESMCLFVST
jgi:hypothetical protein